MTRWTKIWLSLGLGSLVAELLALRVQHATLSEHTRTVFGFDNSGPLPRVRRAAFVAGWAWFGLHICRGTAGCLASAVADVIPAAPRRDP